MTITSNTYVSFDGQCREALDTYARVFSGSTEYMTMEFMSDDPADAGKIAHGEMRSEILFLQGSDWTASMGAPESGTRYSIALMGSGPEDEAQMRAYFDALAEGGSVQTAMAPMPWGGVYGDLTDKFGVRWMVNVQAQTGLAPSEQGVAPEQGLQA